MFERFCEKERCKGKLRTLSCHKTDENTREGGLHTRHENLKAYGKRRGAWAIRKHSLDTR
jgi:hypothetical protein